MNDASVTVLGAGSYGTALAICLARNNTPTVLWGRDARQLSVMADSRQNERYLPGAPFPEALSIESDLATAIAQSRDILVVVPSHAFKGMLEQLAPLLHDSQRIVWATKGLEPGSGRLLKEWRWKYWVTNTRWRCYPDRLSPKKWQRACPRLSPCLLRTMSLSTPWQPNCIAPVHSGFTKTPTLPVCNLAARLKT